MLPIRDVLRRSLAASLSELSPLDRLSAAWPVVAGHALAARSSVLAFHNGVVTVSAQDAEWHGQLLRMATRLRPDLTRVSGVGLTDILFIVPGTAL